MFDWVMIIFTAIIMASLIITLCFAARAQHRYDIILAVNNFTTKTIVVIALLSIVFKSDMYLDVALVYAMINFITTIGFLKYTESGNLGAEDSLKNDEIRWKL